jgi:hypothetical protein
MTSELQGNVVRPMPGRRADHEALCIRGGPWELERPSRSTVDGRSTLGNPAVDTRWREVMRILPARQR